MKATHGHGVTGSQSYSSNGSHSLLVQFTNQNKIFHVVQPASPAWRTERSTSDLSPPVFHPHPSSEESRDTTKLCLILHSHIGCATLTVKKFVSVRLLNWSKWKESQGTEAVMRQFSSQPHAENILLLSPQILQPSTRNLLPIKLIWGSACSSSTGIRTHQYKADQDQYWQFHSSGSVKL